jgi:DNA processing protein
MRSSGEVKPDMRYAYWLANVKGIGNAKKHYLTEQVREVSDLFEMPYGQLKELDALKEEELKALTASRRTWNPDKEWAKLVEKGIGFVSVAQEDYPKRLRNIPGAPYALYYMGKLPKEENKAVAIVGARGRSAYGSEIAQT